MIQQLVALFAVMTLFGGPAAESTPLQPSYALPQGTDPDAVRAALYRADPAASPASDPVAKAIYAWGGADLGGSTRYVTLTAAGQRVTVVGVHADVRRRGPVLGGTRIEFTAESWGINTPYKARLDLDDPHPAAVTRFSIAPGGKLTAEVWATITHRSAEWVLVFDLLVGGHKQEMRLPSALRTTARAASYRTSMTLPRS
jgi:hypothetical protein